MVKEYQKTCKWKNTPGIFTIVLMIFWFGALLCYGEDSKIYPKNLKYLGAFRLPEGSNGSDWSYSGNALTYFPTGDPQGGNDGFAGSLFATGNDTHLFVSEISIPAPKILKNKSIEELNTATTLQPFTNVFKEVSDYLEQPRVGLCYLPAQSKPGRGRIHFSLGLHLQDTGFDSSHGSFTTNLSNPQHTELLTFGNYSGYVTNDYMCKIPKAFADANTKGQMLATGRGREGPWAGGGPALFAYTPTKSAGFVITPLLLYGKQIASMPEISSSKKQQMPDYSDSDRFRGCTWLSKGNCGAVVFTSTKAMGKSWYGFANGIKWDYQCGQQGHAPCPKVPGFPYNDRGFWADDFQARLIFYDPKDLAAIANGHKKSWEPKPYEVMDLSPFFFDPKYTKQDLINYKRDFVGATCYDNQNNRLYIMEPLAEENGRSIIHVFKIQIALKTLPSFQEDRNSYKDSNDSILKTVITDKKLFSKFFDSHETSYKWHILKSDDGIFEDTMDGDVSDKDKIPMKYTSNCVSTHQGEHSMNFCNATLNAGVLRLKIYGGLPAYSSSLLIEIKEKSEFSCFFKAVYPAPVADLKWNILSKKLQLRTLEFQKGQQMFGWLSVEFEETCTYKGEKIAKNYKIEGFIKPTIE